MCLQGRVYSSSVSHEETPSLEQAYLVSMGAQKVTPRSGGLRSKASLRLAHLSPFSSPEASKETVIAAPEVSGILEEW